MRSKILVTVAVVLGSLTGFRAIGIAAGPPATIITWNGTPQSTAAGANFGVALVAVVRDANSNGVQGATVTFTAPGGSAAGATFSGSSTATAISNASGAAVAPTLTANGFGGSYSVTATVAGVAGSAVFSLTNTGGTSGGGAPQAPVGLKFFVATGPPGSVTPSAGTPQSTTVGTSFSTLQALVNDASANPVSGVSVTFASPTSGASALFGGTSSSTVTTNTSGIASASVTANGTVGSYVVTASVAGVATPASFSLTNVAVPTGGGAGGTWTNVTPGNANVTSDINGCSNFGTTSITADPQNSGTIYAEFNCQGIWKSTDFGRTWNGPISPMTAGLAAGPGVLYAGGMSAPYMGFWRSTNGGVTWTNYNIGPAASGRQDVYPPTVDPYDGNHLLMAGHEQDLLVESSDGGQTWRKVPLASGMLQGAGTAYPFFINTGNAGTTRQTWLWLAQQSGGTFGTWRTTDAGASWSRVDSNEHPHGESQIYQPDTSGVIYMAGIYSARGWGVLRSTDFGQTWTHVGNSSGEGIVFGTPNRVYAMWAWACGKCTVDPAFQSAAQPGTAGWSSGSTPAGMNMGPASAVVLFDGTHYVIVTANWNSGLWRYVE